MIAVSRASSAATGVVVVMGAQSPVITTTTPAGSGRRRNTLTVEGVVTIALAKRWEVVGLVASGWSAQAAAERVGVSSGSAERWSRLAGMRLQKGKLGGLAELRKRRVKAPRPRAEAPAGPFLDGNGRLDLAGRVLIQIRLRERCSYRRIAAELGVSYGYVVQLRMSLGVGRRR